MYEHVIVLSAASNKKYLQSNWHKPQQNLLSHTTERSQAWQVSSSVQTQEPRLLASLCADKFSVRSGSKLMPSCNETANSGRATSPLFEEWWWWWRRRTYFIIFSLLLHERKCPKERVFPDDWASLAGYPWTIQSLREKHALTSSDQRQVHMADWGWGWNNWKYLHSIIKKNRGMDADRQATIPTAAVLLELQYTHKPCWGSPQMHIQIQQVCSGDKHPALPAACGSWGAAGPPGTHRSYSTPVSVPFPEEVTSSCECPAAPWSCPIMVRPAAGCARFAKPAHSPRWQCQDAEYCRWQRILRHQKLSLL